MGKRSAKHSDAMMVSAVVWVLLLAIGPLLGYAIGSNVNVQFTLDSWTWRIWTRIVLAAVLPVTGVAWYAFDLRRAGHSKWIWPCVLGTVCLATTTLPAVLWLLEGPTKERVRVDSIGCGSRTRRSKSCVQYEAVLTDGRKLLLEPEQRNLLRSGEERTVTHIAGSLLAVEPER